MAGLLAALARAECGPMQEVSESAAVLARTATGWRIEHWLPAGHEITPLLATVLARRGPRLGVDEKIYFDGGDGELTAPFVRAGWSVVVAARDRTCPGEPQMRVFSPDGVMAWSGGYRSDELKSEGAEVLDDLVLLRVARGKAGPARVPVGCSTPVSTAPTSGKLFSWL